ncbi:MAG: prepilin-type N-terminal cleavage/methylation domain-containing protein [Planctomycetes bacterium]|nr:prepilin-type N-terminal cleavage/methylation domain-containing protein [Planctomycetota bacterium]
MSRDGFTLLELLVVIAILAIVAGAAVVAFEGVETEADERLLEKEILSVREAVLAFHRDTGCLPRQGPLALVPDGGRVPVPAGGRDWFLSPANAVQLYEEPLDASGTPIMPFDRDRGRGWRGPYLTRFAEGWVDAGAGLGTDGSGSPTAGPVLEKMPGVADPFEHPPVGNYLVWRALAGGRPLPRHGRPFLFFDLARRDRARVVSMGPDGIYEAGSGDDVTIHLFR